MISCVQIVSTCLKAVCWLPYSYGNYIRENLDEKVNLVYQKLSDSSRVAQLLMPAAGRLGLPKEEIDELTKKGMIGGVLMLNGTVNEFTSWIKEYEAVNTKKGY